MGIFELWSGPSNIKEFPEEASQSFAKGDLVILDSTGEVEIATNGADVYGVAAEDASTTTGTMIKVHVVTPTQVWSIESAGTPAASHVGLPFDVENFTTGLTTVDLSSAGTDLVIQSLDPRDTAASGTRVLVSFVPDSCDSWGG